MKRSPSRLAFAPALALAAALVLDACGSTPPVHFYSLVPPPAAAAARAARFRIDVQDVDLPAQVGVPQIVVRTGPEELVPVETRRWIAPLAEEIRNALSVDLGNRLDAQDIHGQAYAAGDLPVYRIGVAVQRFDSALGAYARIDAQWSLSTAGRPGALSCFTSATETVPEGYEALAAGHQRALAHIADAIAAAVSAVRQNGTPPTCPTA
ncbi:MAG: membrane integrity-associated transporter subunit PqiC [Nevskia sp.]|nr:membrane integrity-associated transporter subunit PqiC [Nevskia sp.]